MNDAAVEITTLSPTQFRPVPALKPLQAQPSGVRRALLGATNRQQTPRLLLTTDHQTHSRCNRGQCDRRRFAHQTEQAHSTSDANDE